MQYSNNEVEDKRRYKRYALRVPVRGKVKGKNFALLSWDISNQGLYIESGNIFETGSMGRYYDQERRANGKWRRYLNQ